MSDMLDFAYDAPLRQEGYSIICGVDEAGRGPLMGPVVAAACIFPADFDYAAAGLDKLNDSKKLTEKKREALFDIICENALSYSIASASVEEIEAMNILNAAMLSMKRAVAGLHIPADFALIDGNKLPALPCPSRYVISGDAIVPQIAAASILAKVTRDRICEALDAEYPEYGFAKHKGYGTKAHYEALGKFGPSPVHRISFLKKLYDEHGNFIYSNPQNDEEKAQHE